MTDFPLSRILLLDPWIESAQTGGGDFFRQAVDSWLEARWGGIEGTLEKYGKWQLHEETAKGWEKRGTVVEVLAILWPDRFLKEPKLSLKPGEYDISWDQDAGAAIVDCRATVVIDKPQSLTAVELIQLVGSQRGWGTSLASFDNPWTAITFNSWRLH